MENNSDNKRQNELKQVEKLAKNAASGNVLGAAKNAIELAKSEKVKKMRRRQLIISIIQFVMPMIIIAIMATSFFSILTSAREKMIELLSSISTSVSGMWRWMTDDYWIKLDEKIEYTDPDTGEIEEYTLVDKYIKELGSMGVSLKSLRLLGDADYSDEDKLLEDPANKVLVEKYISEFVRADLITQEFHKRRGTELVSPNNEDYIDGGIYLYRTKKEAEVTEDDFNNGNYSEENVQVTDKDFEQMEYMDKEKFDELMNDINNNTKNAKSIKSKFTIDRDTGELIVAKITTTTTIDATVNNAVSSWFADTRDWFAQNGMGGNSESTVEEVRLPYKNYISKYTMPYEFLINLCSVTQNPEFAYHVALLARDTKIVLVIQDDTTVERETVEVFNDLTYYKSGSGPDTASATATDAGTKRTRKATTKVTMTPQLLIEYADTWSFYEEYEYTKNITGEISEQGPVPGSTVKSTLSNYQQPEQNVPYYDPISGAMTFYDIPEYWYDTFAETQTMTQMINTTVTYNGPILVNSVEKSKQFLGLLRNDTGECKYDCYKYKNQAIYCSHDAEFNKKGTNVEYMIPNMERTEAPLNKLTSGIKMLYAVLESNSDMDKDSSTYSADKDYQSIYSEKMQGLSKHLEYLMGFPENENYSAKNLNLFEEFTDIGENKYDNINITESDLEILYKICQAEAGGSSEPEIGHVASVILNRVKCSRFPNTISGVVFQKNQFAPVSNGAFDKAVPTEKTKRAVDSVIAGGDTTGGAVYFRTEASAKSAGMPTSKSETHNYYIYLFTDPNTHVFLTDKQSLYDLGAHVYTDADGELTEMQMRLLNLLNNLGQYSGIENSDGHCQAFVRTVFEKIGVYGSASSATNAGNQWKVSADASNIPVGATVYGEGSGPDGHVGIYIGNGIVVHNIGNSHDCYYGGLKGIKAESMDSWARKYKYKYWGWQGGTDISK